MLTWADVRHLPLGHYILMHSVIYRTRLLRDCGIRLPEHTFYVDNLFVYEPMRMVETLYYLDVDLYHYFIGREDQSVHESVMLRRIDQQLRVNLRMLNAVDLEALPNGHQRQYLFSYLEIITMVSTILLLRAGTPGGRPQARGAVGRDSGRARRGPTGACAAASWGASPTCPAEPGRAVALGLLRRGRKSCSASTEARGKRRRTGRRSPCRSATTWPWARRWRPPISPTAPRSAASPSCWATSRPTSPPPPTCAATCATAVPGATATPTPCPSSAALLARARTPRRTAARTSCYRLGVLLHYAADAFTWPHNEHFGGSLREHMRYERRAA